jgi:2-(1,2-epoxy-1,2-dihydrophenyl)acetyl-CoA isomerase
MASIELEKKGSYAIIHLKRPDKYNAFNREMSLLCQEKLQECDDDDNIRAIMIIGDGKAFSAGQDLEEIIDPNGPDISKILTEHFNPIVRKIRTIEIPVVAAVNGVAAGAGANIALSCDIVMASDNASFIQAFSKIGLIPDSGGTFFLPRLIGFQKASAIMMLGEKISAEDADKMGMVYKVLPHVEFAENCEKLTDKLSKMATRGLALTKEALNHSMTNHLEEQLTLEDKFQTIAGNTADYWEGVASFLEKRKPNFQGK